MDAHLVVGISEALAHRVERIAGAAAAAERGLDVDPHLVVGVAGRAAERRRYSVAGRAGAPIARADLAKREGRKLAHDGQTRERVASTSAGTAAAPAAARP